VTHSNWVLNIRSYWWPISVLVVAGPPFFFERLAQYSYLSHNGLFFIFSGHRFSFDIYYLAFSTAAIAFVSRDLVRSWVANLFSISLLIFLFFAVCDPKLCYSSGYDGLESVRDWLFFSSATLATTYAGWLVRKVEAATRWQRLLASGGTFYAISFYPVMFTLAGARILAPADQVVLPLFLSLLSIVVVLSFSEGRAGVFALVPIASVGLMLLSSLGMVSQYYSDALPTFVVPLVSAAAGAGVAVLFTFRGNRLSRRIGRSRIPITLAVAFVIFTTVVVSPDTAVGYVTSYSGGSMPGSYTYAHSFYAGGFMSSSPMIRPKAVGLQVVFGPNDSRYIPQGGFLAAGIGVHSADCCTDGIDYGYRFDALLWSNGSRSLVGDVWKTCDANGGCGGHPWRVLLFHHVEPLKGVGSNESLNLVLMWVDHSVEWSYSTVSTSHLVATFYAPASNNAAFNAGWDGPQNPSPGGAFFFQFGVSTLSQPSKGWTVLLTCPSVFWDDKWTCVSHAQTLQGDQSYWKALWRWGESFPGVSAVTNSSTHSFVLQSGSPEMNSFTTLW
jgi:hypothetical protein